MNTDAVGSMNTRLTDHDIYLFKQGTHRRLQEKLGAHLRDGGRGADFAVWAPNATGVAVSGDFNGWSPDRNRLVPRGDGSGIWEGGVPEAEKGHAYKFRITTPSGQVLEKGDPFAVRWEEPPRTASVLWDLAYQWTDKAWMASRKERNALNAPQSVYEVHLGSWKRSPDDPDRVLGFRELAHALAEYVTEMGFTHVELLPVTEHPFYGSWGYQTVGYFAPCNRYGSPQDFMYFVDHLHRAGIGVIMDWVPSHFPTDAHGLAMFDGTALFEHLDIRKGFHPDWSSAIFNYGRYEVGAFLISSALFWLRTYHIDGLRVDAVASMLYLDYSREEGEWIPNKYGGNENLEAVEFLRHCNRAVYEEFPDVQTAAEESTSWPGVSRPVYLGGLGFGLKWNMGWMHDTLNYFSNDPVFRKFHHNELTFAIWYAFTENFVLPLSHDEVVHGKGSLAGKMPGDMWQKLANLRLLYGYMFGQPGKKLLFMGGEFGQWAEWNHDRSLDWHLLEDPMHSGLAAWVRDLNRYYRKCPALYERDFHPEGFKWEDCCDADQSVLSFFRRDSQGSSVLVVCNCTPVVREEYCVGVPLAGGWREVLNSDAECYGGSGVGNQGRVEAGPGGSRDFPASMLLTLPPLGVVFLEPEA
jgi:1,4-alpha-glucan branching enzyme